MEYPHRVVIQMSDKMFKEVKAALSVRNMMGGLFGECDLLLLQLVRAIDQGSTNPICLRTIKEARAEKIER